jgi:hypothetical protein
MIEELLVASALLVQSGALLVSVQRKASGDTLKIQKPPATLV